ncbi:MAG: hypothetical protein EP347_09980 [Alphaproteobacteria bacterium]|nr:MAG: hypothetical protein EP347_09980 [Alphaproteobacteria bacterium]
MSAKKSILGPVLEQTFTYVFRNFPTVLKAVGIPVVFLTGITLYYAMPAFIHFIEVVELAEQTGDQTSALSALGPLFANMSLMFLAALLFYPMIITSLTRNIVLGEEVPLLNLSSNVFRVVGAMVLLFLIWMGIAFIGTLLLSAVAGIFSAVGFFPGIFLVFIAYLIAILAFLTKSSLILPDVAISGRLRLTEGWNLSHGYLWPLLGTYFVLTILLGIIGNLIGGLAIAIGSLGFDEAVLESAMSSNSSVQFLTDILNLTRTPIGMFAMLIYILGNILTAGAQFSAFAFAYAHLSNPSADLPSAEN